MKLEMSEYWKKGYSEGFAWGRENNEHPELDDPNVFDAAFSSGFQDGKMFKLFFDLGQEVGPSGLCGGDEEDLEMLVDLFKDAFSQGRDLVEQNPWDVMQERAHNAGFEAALQTPDAEPHLCCGYDPMYVEQMGIPEEEYIRMYQSAFREGFAEGRGDNLDQQNNKEQQNYEANN